MTVQYNVPVLVLDPSREYMIQHTLMRFPCFVNSGGYLDGTRFSKEYAGPYVGDIIIVKTLREDAAKVAHRVLGGVEGLLVLPIKECDYEEDKRRVLELRAELNS